MTRHSQAEFVATNAAFIGISAASAPGLLADYVASLRRWLPRQPLNAGHRDLGEFA
jgi:hypothetical protein